MRLQDRSYSKVTLSDLLRKKKKTLKQFLDEIGIVSYELLKTRCQAMGVQPPLEQDFNTAMGNPLLPETSSPTEGIVVLTSTEEKLVQSSVDSIPVESFLTDSLPLESKINGVKKKKT